MRPIPAPQSATTSFEAFRSSLSATCGDGKGRDTGHPVNGRRRERGRSMDG